MQKVRVFRNALAKHVTGHAASGRTRDAEIKYDKLFKNGGIVEQAWNGDYRLLTLDEAHCFNIPAAKAASIFKAA